MQFKVSRDDQEYGPYTIEELTQYVSEGSLLPNDYVHNGMEWLPLSEFLKNPHKAATSIGSISSVANAQPQGNFSRSGSNLKDSGSESNKPLKAIVSAIIVIVIFGYNFFFKPGCRQGRKV